jgi:hypothetical protein
VIIFFLIILCTCNFFFFFVELVIGIGILDVGFYLVWLHGEWVCLIGYLNGPQEDVEGNENA